MSIARVAIRKFCIMTAAVSLLTGCIEGGVLDMDRSVERRDPSADQSGQALPRLRNPDDNGVISYDDYQVPGNMNRFTTKCLNIGTREKLVDDFEIEMAFEDAIKKGFQGMKDSNKSLWAVPYLPIDPADLGRSYEAVVRINSQSGKGGVAFLLEKDHGVSLPRRLQISMSEKIQKLADESGKEINTSEIWNIFESHFLIPKKGFTYVNHESSSQDDVHYLKLVMHINAKEIIINGSGNGPIDSLINGLSKELGVELKLSDYHQSAISSGSDAKAAAYIELEQDGKTSWGVGINPSTTRASFEAIIVGVSKLSS